MRRPWRVVSIAFLVSILITPAIPSEPVGAAGSSSACAVDLGDFSPPDTTPTYVQMSPDGQRVMWRVAPSFDLKWMDLTARIPINIPHPGALSSAGDAQLLKLVTITSNGDLRVHDLASGTSTTASHPQLPAFQNITLWGLSASTAIVHATIVIADANGQPTVSRNLRISVMTGMFNELTGPPGAAIHHASNDGLTIYYLDANGVDGYRVGPDQIAVADSTVRETSSPNGRFKIIRVGDGSSIFDTTTATIIASYPFRVHAVTDDARFIIGDDGLDADSSAYVLDRTTGSHRYIGSYSGVPIIPGFGNWQLSNDGKRIVMSYFGGWIVIIQAPGSLAVGIGNIPATFVRGQMMELEVQGVTRDGTTANSATFRAEAIPTNIRTHVRIRAWLPSTLEVGVHHITLRTIDGCETPVAINVLDATVTIDRSSRFPHNAVGHPAEVFPFVYRWTHPHFQAHPVAVGGVTSDSRIPPDAAYGFRDVTFGHPYQNVVVIPDGAIVRPYDGEFHPLAPYRVVDTRSGLGGGSGKLGAGESARWKVTGINWIPESGVSAIVANVTVTEPTASGYLSVFAGDQQRPLASNLNFTAGKSVPNLVTVAVAPDGTIKAFNSDGQSHVLIDVVGWYADSSPSSGGTAYVPFTPERVVDTRDDNIPLNPRSGMRVPLYRPESLVRAVALNVTVTQPSTTGYVAVIGGRGPSGYFTTDDFSTSNLNFTRGQTLANMVVVPVGEDGSIWVLNSAGTSHVIVDILGVYIAGAPIPDGQFTATPAPKRVLDTRFGTGAPAAPIGAGNDIRLALARDIPYGATAAVINLTATQPDNSGFLVTWPNGEPRPLASNLNFTNGQTVPNLVIATLGPDRSIRIGTGGANTHIIADLVGWMGPGPGYPLDQLNLANASVDTQPSTPNPASRSRNDPPNGPQR